VNRVAKSAVFRSTARSCRGQRTLVAAEAEVVTQTKTGAQRIKAIWRGREQLQALLFIMYMHFHQHIMMDLRVVFPQHCP
jgi:hypothetical protein